MSISKKLLQSSAAAAVCNSESMAPFGEEASYNKNIAIYQFDNSLDDGVGSVDGTGSGGFSYSTDRKFGSHSLAVDGTDGKVSLGNQTWFNSGDYSVSFWMKNEGNDSNYQYMISQRTSSDSTSPINVSMYGVSYSSNPGDMYFSVGSSWFRTDSNLSKNTWYHIAFTVIAGGAMKAYVNGVHQTVAAGSSNPPTETTTRPTPTTQNLAIGTNGSNTDYPFNGKIDQLRIYKKALTQEEVTTLYLDETDDTASLNTIIKGTSCVAYYPLDYDASDKSGNFNGSSTGVEFGVNGKINYAARFDGSTSYIQMADNIFQYSAQSISMWFWGPPSTSGWNTLFNNTGYISGQRFLGYVLACVNDKLLLYASNTSVGSDASYTMSASYTIGAWNFIVMTIDSTNHLKLYLNGASAESFTTGGYGFNTSYPMDVTIGTRKSGQHSCTSGCEWYTGVIDEVRVFNRLLTSTEATTLYELTACSHTCTTDNQDFVATNTIYYKLAGDAADYHGGTYDGTAANLTYTPGRFGTAADFTNSGKINTGYTTNDSAFSISTWVKFTGSPSSEYNYIASKGYYNNSSSTNYFQIVTYNNQYPEFRVRLNSGSNVGAISSVGVTKGIWYHIGATCDSSGNLKIYLNGSQTGSASGAPARSMGQAMYIGSYFDGSWASGFFKGLIDNFRYFSSALTAANIQDLYNTEYQCYITKNASDPFGSGEVAFFNFNNNLTDSTGSYAASASSVSYTTTDPAFGTHSLSFNDSSNYIDFGTNGIPLQSVSYWVKMNANGHNTRDTLIYSEETSSTYFGCTRWGSNDGATGFYAGGSYWNYSGTDWALTGKWHHIYQDKDLNVYLNGVQINSGSVGATSQNIRYIGKYPTGASDYYMNGYMDHLRVFNTKLTGDQIWQLYSERNN